MQHSLLASPLESDPASTPSLAAATGVGLGPRSHAQSTCVAYIGGTGRSGSTMLALLLAQLPGIVAVGGLGNLWERGLQGNYLCGCGAHFRDCAFWSEVGRDAFGGWDNLDANEILRLKDRVTRHRHLPWLIAPHLRPAFLERLTTYADYIARLYRSIAKVSHCSVIVDNSHDVPSALLLRHALGIRGHIVHLVRDSRGVAFSDSKHVLRPEVTNARMYMHRSSPVESSLYWLLANLLLHVITPRCLPRLRVHYEALIRSPSAEVARIGEFLGLKLSPSDLSFLQNESIALAPNHMISGNPHRLGRTLLGLRLDQEWRTKMRPADRKLVTLLTAPLAWRYGYLVPSRSWRNETRRDDCIAAAGPHDDA